MDLQNLKLTAEEKEAAVQILKRFADEEECPVLPTAETVAFFSISFTSECLSRYYERPRATVSPEAEAAIASLAAKIRADGGGKKSV